jgi:hypothetical protein
MALWVNGAEKNKFRFVHSFLPRHCADDARFLSMQQVGPVRFCHQDDFFFWPIPLL